MANRYWVSGGNGLWGSTTNWSTASGGASGASVPGTADAAIFNASSGAGTATVDSNVTIQTLTMTGFTGTLAFGTNSISLNSTGTVFTGATTCTITGTPVINVTSTSTGASAITVAPGAVTEANSISFNFTGGSYSLIFLATANHAARDVNFTGFSGLLNSTSTCTIYGNLTLSTGMTFTFTSSVITFGSTSGTKTLTSNGKTLDAPLRFNGVGGTWQLLDALTLGSSGDLYHTNGTIDLNGKTLTCPTTYRTEAGTKNLTFNGGTFVSGTAFNNTQPTGYTTTAGTGVGKISLIGASPRVFTGGGSTYNCTVSIDVLGVTTFTGSNTFTTLANTVQPITVLFTSGTTTTITNWGLKGVSGSLVTIDAPTFSTFTLSKASGTVVADYVSISNSAATGGANWYALITCTRGSGNSGWVFGTTKYWVGGTGNWSSAAKWSTASGGAGGAGAPAYPDILVFDGLSGGGTSTLDSSFSAQTLTMTGFTGTLAFGTNTISLTSEVSGNVVFTSASSMPITGTPVINITNSSANGIGINTSTGTVTEANSISFNFTAGTYILSPTTGDVYRNLNFTGFSGSVGGGTATVYGDLTLSSGMSISSSTTSLSLRSTSATPRVITTNGVVINKPLIFNGVGGTWQLADALTMLSSRALTHTNGTINLNGKTLTVGTAYTTATGTKNLTFNGGTLVCPTASTTAFNNAQPTNYTTTAGTGTGKISMTAATAKTFVGGGSTFNCTLSNDGAGALTITGTNTFTTIANGVQPTSFLFTAATTTTVTNWSVNGTAGNLVTIGSVTAATHTLSKASGTVSSDYLSISFSTATGGAAWYAGNNSTNGGNNTGWLFSAPPIAYSITATNGTYTLNGQSVGIKREVVLSGSYGSYAVTGRSITIAKGSLLLPQNGLYSLAGQTIDISYSGAPPVTGPTQYFIEIRSFTETRRI